MALIPLDVVKGVAEKTNFSHNQLQILKGSPVNMHIFRTSLSRLAIATVLLGSTVSLVPEPAAARTPCGAFTINWGGTVPREDILSCAVEYNTGARRRDRYYLEVRGSKITSDFRSFELSFPENFDGEVNDQKIRVKVNGREVELDDAATAWNPESLPETPASGSQQILDRLATTANTPPNRGGELVFVDGELVFLDAETLANQSESEPINSQTPSRDSATSQESTDEEPPSNTLLITLAEPLEPEDSVEIILDSVQNPSRGGMYLVTAFARSQGAPLPNKLGSWFIDVDF